jgi:uncharacterized protein (DUF58 family)
MVLTAKEMQSLSALRVAVRDRIRNRTAMDYRSMDAGGNLEFQDYQPYVPGETIRCVDWNRYLQDGSLMIRQYQKPEKPDVTVVVDLSRSVAASGKSREVKRFSAALCFCLLNRNLSVKLLAGKNQLSGSGPGSWPRLHGDLEALPENNRDSAIGDFSHLRVSQTIVIVSDLIFSDGFEQFKKQFNPGHRSCSLFNVSTPLDRHPDLRGNLSLLDSQNGRRLKCMVNEAVLEGYKSSRSAYYANIMRHCRKMQWCYREILTENSLYEQIQSICSNGTLIV